MLSARVARLTNRLARRRVFAGTALGLALLVSLTWAAQRGLAQLDPGDRNDFAVYQTLPDGRGTVEAGRVFRDGAGAVYTEHWVLFPNYRFDQGGGPGRSMSVVAERGAGYKTLGEFLGNVPFPRGSRYIVAVCTESDALPE